MSLHALMRLSPPSACFPTLRALILKQAHVNGVVPGLPILIIHTASDDLVEIIAIFHTCGIRLPSGVNNSSSFEIDSVSPLFHVKQTPKLIRP